MSAENLITCPICGKMFKNAIIMQHANSCLNSEETVCNEKQPTVSCGVKRKSSDWDFFTKKKPSGAKFESRAKSSKNSKSETDNRIKKVWDYKRKELTENDANNIIDVDEESDNSAKASENENRSSNTDSLLSHKSSEKKTSQVKTLNTPLAEKVRPQSLDEFVGQTKAVGKKSLLHSLLLKGNNIPSMVLWGPPGCGKDALLPHVENGIITLIGATTENPSFHINSALLSRCQVITLDKLQMEDIKMIVKRACHKMGVRIQKSQEDNSSVEGRQGEKECQDNWVEQEFSLDSFQNENPIPIYIEETALDALSGLVDGDARAALNGLQTTVQARLMEERQKEGDEKSDGIVVVVTLDNVKEGLQKSHILYDRNGEEHFNIASAMIKSMRGSNDSAALYWMTRMLEGGENPLFVARRLVVFASEDVGLADPTALNLAVSTFQACQLIGMPECAINLAHCVVYLSRALKSVESFTGYHHAKQCVQNHQGPLPSVPLHLRNAPTQFMKKMGCGEGYKYPPAFEGEVNQEYFPPSLVGTDFFAFMKEQRPRDKTVAAIKHPAHH